jgi:predicted DNA-binding transcriptional regulator AlpA
MATPQATRQPLGTVAEVAAYLGTTANALYIMRRRRTGPRASKVGRELRYRWADVEKWLDQRADSSA